MLDAFRESCKHNVNTEEGSQGVFFGEFPGCGGRRQRLASGLAVLVRCFSAPPPLKKKKHSKKPPGLSRGKYALFAAITICLPLALLAIAELALRLLGLGGYPPFIREAGRLATGESVCLVEPTSARPYFFANPERPGFGKQYNFLMPKPEGTVRIFLFGESAAQGYPQPRNMAMSSFLRAMLSDLSPDRAIEVINMGTTAVASFPIVYQVREALRYDPSTPESGEEDDGIEPISSAEVEGLCAWCGRRAVCC
jgi:hypothetical protein